MELFQIVYKGVTVLRLQECQLTVNLVLMELIFLLEQKVNALLVLPEEFVQVDPHLILQDAAEDIIVYG